MRTAGPSPRRNLTPRAISNELGISPAKVIRWIRTGELPAINVANRGCRRPRYSVTPEALAEFMLARQVAPDSGDVKTRRLRRRIQSNEKDYFPD